MDFYHYLIIFFFELQPLPLPVGFFSLSMYLTPPIEHLRRGMTEGNYQLEFLDNIMCRGVIRVVELLGKGQRS